MENFVPQHPQHDHTLQGAVDTVQSRLHNAGQGLDEGLHSMGSVVGQGGLGELRGEGRGMKGGRWHSVVGRRLEGDDETPVGEGEDRAVHSRLTHPWIYWGEREREIIDFSY